MNTPDPIIRLSAALEGSYRVESSLGEGGMANVYLAEDLKHERRVALKVLKPEVAAAVGAERFLSEIKTTANLNHPAILALHDSGDADGLLFYVMPYVEGESLRDKLDREPQLPVDEAVRIATEVAEALDYAHRQGVVHRDIKPANILLVEGRAVVADFGIALAADSVGGGRLTETGLSLGTPHYMSPEQAAGDESIDARADTYALGCVLYEMLVGEPPHTGRTPQAILGRIMQGEARPVTDERPAVPAQVDAVVRKALEKLPADRFQTTGEFAEALSDETFRHRSHEVAGSAPAASSRPSRGFTIGLSAVAVVALVVAAVIAGRSGAIPEAPERSVAVLPFEDRSPDGDQAYFAEGLSEEIQIALGRLEGLTLMANASAFALQRHGLEREAIAERLEVAHVVEGSVQRIGDRVRVRAFLVHAPSGRERWSGSFEERIDDVFAIQDSISIAIANELQVAMAESSGGPLVSVATNVPEAHDAYLLGRYLLARGTPADTEEAIEHFARAVSLDSLYSEAWAGLGFARMQRAEIAVTDDYVGLRSRSLEAAERAVVLDPDLGFARAALGWIAVEHGQWDRARAEVALAIQLSPSDPFAHHQHSWVSWITGAVDEAVQSGRIALRLDPMSTRSYYNLSWALAAAGQAEEAVASVRRGIELSPDVPRFRMSLSGFLLDLGRLDEARQANAAWARVAGADSVAEAEMMDAVIRYQTTGEATELDYPAVFPRNPGVVAAQYALSGQPDRSIESLEFLEAAGAYGAISFFHVWKLGEVLGEYPRYQALLERVGITW